jgi:natural product precursor
MKKISLKNVKGTLSRKEMRAISGGYLFGRHCGDIPYTYSTQCCSYAFGISYNCNTF